MEETYIFQMTDKYGLPIVMAVGLAFVIQYVWQWCSKEVKPVLKNTNVVLTALMDRVTLLNNDLIRLSEKINTVLTLREKDLLKNDSDQNKK
jgi:hypothetical protein